MCRPELHRQTPTKFVAGGSFSCSDSTAMNTQFCRALSLAILAGALFAIPVREASAATRYVAAVSINCAPDVPGTGTLADPWVNLFYALTRGNLQPGDTLMLRGGTYRNLYNAFLNTCGVTGTGGLNTILPLVVAGTKTNPIVIQNYPGEIVVLDGTDADMVGSAWTNCGTNSWQNINFNVGRARTPQIWVNPATPGDPGTRMAFDDSGTSCTGMRPGTFRVASDGRTLYVRLPDDSNVNSADVHMSCQNGDCAAYPIDVEAGAAWITVRRNAAGGAFYVKYGYYNAFINGGAHDIIFDGVQFVAAGGRDYGQCVRTANGSFITVRNGTCREAMGEGIAFYGGGPGGAQSGEGINITDNLLQNMDVLDTGRGFIDLGGTGDNLGMGVIVKNCSGCSVIGNRIRNTVGPAIHVTTSTTAGVQSASVRVDGNEIYNFGHRCSAPCPLARTFTAINIEPQTNGANGAVRDVVVTNNSIHNEGFVPTQNEVPEGIVVSDSGFTPVSGVIIENNSLRHLQGVCVDLWGAASIAVVRNNSLALCSLSGTTGAIAYFAREAIPHIHDHNAYWSVNEDDNVVAVGSPIPRSAIVAVWEDSAIVVEPLFTSVANLTPSAGSPLIDAGTSEGCPPVDQRGFGRPAGGRCDIGAFEFGAVLPRTPITPSNLRIIRK